MVENKTSKIGIIGTGFIGTGLKHMINLLPDLEISCILTQRNLMNFPDEDVYTNSTNELIDRSDLVVECNGNPIYATEILCQVMDADIPVVTMDAELHITAGSYLSTKGLITEAEGDQPGALAALDRDLINIGFKPLVYGNLKGFLNILPTREEMRYWSKKQGISIEQVTSATDGTKIQIEQALVANGLDAVVAKQGLYGFETSDIVKDAEKLAKHAKEIGRPISDYLLRSPQMTDPFPKGVFITAEHDPLQADALAYLKLGEGPYYTIIRNYYLCHIEIPVTIRDVLSNHRVLLDNGSHPTASVCAIAKEDLSSGKVLNWNNRNFFVRGEAISIKDKLNHVPVGLMNEVIFKRRVKSGQIIEMDDVEIPETKAYEAWQYTLSLVK